MFDFYKENIKPDLDFFAKVNVILQGEEINLPKIVVIGN